jgi:hydroxymethylglutaryl-CoA reductase (NADPH)
MFEDTNVSAESQVTIDLAMDDAPMTPESGRKNNDRFVGIGRTSDYTANGVNRRRAELDRRGINVAHLAGHGAEPTPEELRGNIENLIGFARLPVGVIGPLRVCGDSANGDFYVPLATTEGALVASYHRGALLVSRSGGVAVQCISDSIRRTPCFAFERVAETEFFLRWLDLHADKLAGIVEQTSRYCRLLHHRAMIVGRELFLLFEFSTGDAAGQNMVTLATEAICKWLIEQCPVSPRHWVLDGNLSGDKKATSLALISGRGKNVVAEAVVNRSLVRRFLHTQPEQIVANWNLGTLGAIQSGAIGAQAHVANALTALFIACGQDVACVAEASVGVTRLDLTEPGDLYISLCLPNLTVGTVGGGTWLPTARNCLEMMGCFGPGEARKFAAICAATALVGELSLIGSMSAGDFAQAHRRYGRRHGNQPAPEDRPC